MGSYLKHTSQSFCLGLNLSLASHTRKLLIEGDDVAPVTLFLHMRQGNREEDHHISYPGPWLQRFTLFLGACPHLFICCSFSYLYTHYAVHRVQKEMTLTLFFISFLLLHFFVFHPHYLPAQPDRHKRSEGCQNVLHCHFN